MIPCVGLVLAFATLAARGLCAAETFTLPEKSSAEMRWWREAAATRDQRLGWWREARFGMFIHWGVYSTLGNEYKGKKGGGYAEHIQRVLKIPIPEYRDRVAAIFNPTKFDADAWVRLAKEAGMGYLVITAKHHDGFAMYDSAVRDYNVVKGTPWHHDPMKDLKAACDKYGVKFGFYYSHAFDWGDAEAPGNDWDYENPGGDRNLYGGRNWWESEEGAKFLPQVRHYVDTKSIPQIRELIANYHPAILWFDTPHKLPPSENYRIIKATRLAGPDVVINGRLFRGLGDYDSTADRPAEFSPHEGDWEGIPTTNESYGYNRFDHSHKPPAHFIQTLAKAAARGGNLLMNIGPKGDGTFDEPDVAILRSIAQWMKVNQEAIRGTDRTTLQVQSWGESTRKGNRLYLHIFDYPKDGTLTVGGLRSGVVKAYLLADPSKTPLATSRSDPLDLTIDLPADFIPDPADTVLVVECDGAPVADAARLISAVSTNTLRTLDARLEGKGLKYGAGKRQDAYVTGWEDKDQSISWPARVTRPGAFNVKLVGDVSASGGRFRVDFGSQGGVEGEISGESKGDSSRVFDLGTMRLSPGSFDITLSAVEIKDKEVMRPRSLVLTPITQ